MARYRRDLSLADPIELNDDGEAMTLEYSKGPGGLFACSTCGASQWGRLDDAPRCTADHGDLDDEGVRA